jgi:hypothetical protein
VVTRAYCCYGSADCVRLAIVLSEALPEPPDVAAGLGMALTPQCLPGSLSVPGAAPSTSTRCTRGRQRSPRHGNTPLTYRTAPNG